MEFCGTFTQQCIMGYQLHITYSEVYILRFNVPYRNSEYLLRRCLGMFGVRFLGLDTSSPGVWMSSFKKCFKKCFMALYGLIIVPFSLGVNRKYNFSAVFEAQVPLAREMSIPSSSSLTVELTCEETKILTKSNQHDCHYKHNLEMYRKRSVFFFVISKTWVGRYMCFLMIPLRKGPQKPSSLVDKLLKFPMGQFLLPSLAPSFSVAKGCGCFFLRDTQTERSQDVCWRWYFVSGKLATLPGPYKSPAPPWVWVTLGGRKENWVAWSKLEANPRNFMENIRRSPPLIHGNIMKPL